MNIPAAAPKLTEASTHRREQDDLPRWVLACWPRTWREHYGEEMSQTWCDEGAPRKTLLFIAVHGLRQRAMRPVAAASLDAAGGRPCHDVAIVGHPRYLLRFLIAIAATLVIFSLQIGLGLAMDLGNAGVGYSEASMRREDLRRALLMVLSTGLPLAIAAWGCLRLNDWHSRDSGFGLMFGALFFVLFPFILLAVPA